MTKEDNVNTLTELDRAAFGDAYEAGLKTYRDLMSIDHDFGDEYLVMAIVQDALGAIAIRVALQSTETALDSAINDKVEQ